MADAAVRTTGRLPAIAAVVLVVAAAALVAVAATGAGLLLPALSPGAGWLRALRLLGLAVLAAGVAGLVWQRGRIPPSEDRRHDPTVAALAAAGSMMTVLFVLALVSPRPLVESTATEEDPAAAEEQGGTEESSARERPSGRQGEALPGGFGLGAGQESPGGIALPEITAAAEDAGVGGAVLELLRRIALAALLVAVVVLALLALTGRLSMRRSEGEPEPIVAVEEAEAGLEASLTELGYEGDDPRRRITAAYQRLLAALADAGAPRAPQEAPHEHLHRALGPLGVLPEPMHRLTELYVAAQFSEHPITERHRAAAADALEQALAGLRSRLRTVSAGARDGGAPPEAAPA